MKKCVSCSRDLPDTAMHCSYCGSMQSSVPGAPVPGQPAKTLLGYAAGDELKQMLGKTPPPERTAPPAIAPPPGLGPAPQSQSGFGPAPPQAQQPTMVASNASPIPGAANPPLHEAKTVAASVPPGGFPPLAAGAQAPPPMAGPLQAAAPMGGFAPGYPPAQAPMPPGAPYGPGMGNPGMAPGMSNPGMMMPGMAPGMGNPGMAPGMSNPGMMPGVMPGMGGGPGMAPGMGGMSIPFNPVTAPATAQVAPLQSPPYLASQTAARLSAPQEPWADSIKPLMLACGIALVLCFVLPWALAPKVGFSWDLIKAAPGKEKLLPLLMAGTGLLGVVLSLLPLVVMVRGVAAAALGFVPLAIGTFVLGKPDMQSILELFGALTLVSGLLVRSQYHDSIVPRLMVVIGVACMLVPAFLADYSLIDRLRPPIKIETLVGLVPYVLALVGLLLTWLPSPSSMGTHGVAWALLVWSLVASLIRLITADAIGAAVKTSTAAIFWHPVTEVAWSVLLGYGVATVVGKTLEHR